MCNVWYKLYIYLNLIFIFILVIKDLSTSKPGLFSDESHEKCIFEIMTTQIQTPGPNILYFVNDMIFKEINFDQFNF